MTLRASWGADSRYKAIDEMEDVTLGDIFNQSHSTRWHDEQAGELGNARHQVNPEGQNMVKEIGAITEDILSYNVESLVILRSLGEDEAINLPPTSLHGNPVIDATEHIPG